MWDERNWRSNRPRKGSSLYVPEEEVCIGGFTSSMAFHARYVELPDAVLEGRVDFGGAQIERSLRMTRARIDGSLTLEWRPHSVADHNFWIAKKEELRTVVGGRLDLDKICVTGSIMARGIRVVEETILTGCEITGAANFRAWHISEREENGLMHVRWVPGDDLCLDVSAVPTQLLGGFYGRHLKVGTLLNLTGAEVGAHGSGMTSQDAVNLDSAQVGFLSMATWRHHRWSEYSRKPGESYQFKENKGYHLPSLIHGAVRLTDARVSSSIRMNGAQIDGRLIANGLKVEGNFDLSSFVAITPDGAQGWLCNIPLEVGKAVQFASEGSGNQTEKERTFPIALNARQMRIGGALEFDGSIFHGGIRVDGLNAGKVTLDVRGGAGQNDSCISPTVVKCGKIVHHQWSFKMHHGRIAGTFSMRGAQMESGVSLYASEIRGGIQAGPTKIGEKLFRTAIGSGGTEIHYAKTPGSPLRSDHYSLYIAHTKIGGDVCLDAPALAGPLQAEGATISGSLTMRTLAVEPMTASCNETKPWWVIQWPMPPGTTPRHEVTGNAIALSKVVIGQSLEITGLRLYPGSVSLAPSQLPQKGVDLRGQIDLRGAQVGSLHIGWQAVSDVLGATPTLTSHPSSTNPQLTPPSAFTRWKGVFLRWVAAYRDPIMGWTGAFCGIAPAMVVMGLALIYSKSPGDIGGSVCSLAFGIFLWFLALIYFTIYESGHALRSELFSVDGLAFDSIQVSPTFEDEANPNLRLKISSRIVFTIASGLAWSSLLAVSWPRWNYEAVDKIHGSLLEKALPFIGGNLTMCFFVLMLWLTVLHRFLVDKVARGDYEPGGLLDRYKHYIAADISEATNDRNLRTFLFATRFDAAFYSRVEKWLQKEGNRAGAGRVTRMLQRRLIQQSFTPNLPSAVGSLGIHILFGHGTRLWPAVIAYALFAINGYHIFSDTKALKLDDSLRTQRLTLALNHAQSSDGVWNATKGYLSDEGSWLPDLNALRREAKKSSSNPSTAPISSKKLPFGDQPAKGSRDALGPILRAAIPFASFALKDDLTYSDNSIEIGLKAPMSKIFLIPNQGSEPRNGLTYAEYAAILTIMGWILLPIFLVKLVSQMRRLEVRDFEE